MSKIDQHQRIQLNSPRYSLFYECRKAEDGCSETFAPGFPLTSGMLWMIRILMRCGKLGWLEGAIDGHAVHVSTWLRCFPAQGDLWIVSAADKQADRDRQSTRLPAFAKSW
jgi:hypothetical protein